MSEITLTLREADEIFLGVEDLASKTPRDGLPTRMGYRAGKMHRKIKAELADFQKTRMDVIQRLGAEDEEDGKKTGTWTIPKENLEEFTREIDDLLSEEIILSGVAKVELDLENDLDIDGKTLATLEPILEITE